MAGRLCGAVHQRGITGCQIDKTVRAKNIKLKATSYDGAYPP